MNEIELIRNQLAAERAHASAVANACAAALGLAAAAERASSLELTQFRQACVEYLVCVLAWFEERDQRLADFARAYRANQGPSQLALEQVLAQPGRSREALEKLDAACAALTAAATSGGSAQQSWQEFAHYFNEVWTARREAVDALLAPNPRVSDWRAVAGIDADSILEERQRYARVGATLPAGVTLAAPPARGEVRP
jgi:hypothetical protein